MPDDMVALRCRYCGAPLDGADVRSDSPYVTCSSCGTTQQRMDAKAYLDEMMVQVKSWLSSAIPSGLGAGGVENVDPVARHNIFVRDVKPKVELELTEYRFSSISLLGNCLLAMPFSTSSAIRPAHTSAKAFEFNAKVKSVSPLAVDDESRALIEDAASTSQSYALMLNNAKLLGEEKDGRYALMANNFAESSRVLRESKGPQAVMDRFAALADVCGGLEKLMEGDTANSAPMIRSGKERLEAMKGSVFADPQYGIMYQAIEQEISVCGVVLSILDMVGGGPGADVQVAMDVVRRVMDMKLEYPQRWGFLLGSRSRYNEVFGSMMAALGAKAGGTVPVAAGAGDALMPFWEVDLKYSFTTGSLWKKKSVEVKEDLLVCCDFVADPQCLSDPSSAVTDIFKVRPPKSILAGITGAEKSISQGQGIGRIQDSVSDLPAGSRAVILPLSTKAEAEKLCVEYLDQRARSDDKLKLSNPEVRRIVYVPCRIAGGRAELPRDFGALVPAHVERMDAGAALKIE